MAWLFLFSLIADCMGQNKIILELNYIWIELILIRILLIILFYLIKQEPGIKIKTKTS